MQSRNLIFVFSRRLPSVRQHAEFLQNGNAVRQIAVQVQGVKPAASQVHSQTPVGAESAVENVPRARPAADLHRGEERAVPSVHQLQDQHEVHTVSALLRYIT